MADTHTGKLLHGQQYRSREDIIVPYTEQMVNFSGDEGVAALGNARTEIIPEDAQSAKVRVWTPTPEIMDAFVREISDTVDLRLPDVLTGITVTYNEAEGAGTHVQTGDGASAGTSAALSLSLPSKGQCSASIVPDIQPVIRQKWAFNIPCKKYLFYIEGNYSSTDLLTRLNTITGATVNEWPKFEPEIHVFTLKGVTASAAADASVSQSVSISDSGVTLSYGEGEGTSYDISTTTRTIIIPPTIHGVINLSGVTSKTAALTASASASWTGETNWPARSAAAAINGIITASVTPTSLAATTPSAIPTSGLYLYSTQAEPWEYGYIAVQATIVDFANV